MEIPIKIVADSIVVDDKQAYAYYEKHKSEYKTPEQVKVDYVLLSLNDMKNKNKPTEKQLQELYNEIKDSLPKNKKEFKSAKSFLTEQWTKEHIDAEFAKAAESMTELSYQNADSLETVSKSLNLPILTSNFFTIDSEDDSLSKYEQFRKAAFSQDVLEGGHNSEAVALGQDKLVVLRIKEKQPALQLSFDKVKQKIISQIKIDAAKKLVVDWGRKLLKDEPIASHSKELVWKTKNNIIQGEEMTPAMLVPLAFQMSITNPQNAAFLDSSTYVVMKLVKINPGKVDKLKISQKQNMTKQVANSLGKEDFDHYVKSLVAKSHVERAE